MTAAQNAYFSMISTLLTVCSRFLPVWNDTPSFKSAFLKLQDEVNEKLPDTLARQNQRTTGITMDKKNVRLKLETDLLTIANAMEAYATTIGDNTLRRNVHLVTSDMNRLTDRGLIGEATRIATLATENLAHLESFHVKPQDVTTLQETAATYSTWLGRPQATIDDKKDATHQLDAIVRTARKMLDIMDTQMVLFRVSAAEFYSQYFSAREIVNPATRHRAITFRVLDEQQQPVPDVKIFIPALRIEKCTGPSGTCFVQHAPGGNYEVRASKNGYAVADIRVAVNDGERTKAEVVMHRA